MLRLLLAASSILDGWGDRRFKLFIIIPGMLEAFWFRCGVVMLNPNCEPCYKAPKQHKDVKNSFLHSILSSNGNTTDYTDRRNFRFICLLRTPIAIHQDDILNRHLSHVIDTQQTFEGAGNSFNFLPTSCYR